MSVAHQLLEVEIGATKAEIKKAYRKLALRYHPDVNNSEDAKSRFILIQKAYFLLLKGGELREMPASKTTEMARQFEEEQKVLARERAKERVRKMRQAQEEAFMQSRVYKVAVGIKRTITYLTVAAGLVMIIVPLVSVFLEWNTSISEPKRWFSFVLIAGLGFFFLWSGIYLIKNKVE